MTTAIIPARLASTRFPEKVLASATGTPLIVHVWRNALRCSSLSRVVIAADHERVARAARDAGAEVVLTSPDHPNGTSRLSEAAGLLGLRDDEIIVNVQGDEPELEPEVIDAAVRAARVAGASVGTVATPLSDESDLHNPAIVKVVRALSGAALYFTRSVVPFPRDADAARRAGFLRHVGIYAYAAGFVKRYAAMAPTPLERAESLEQLRVLEHSLRVQVEVASSSSAGIDTPEQYEAFVSRWKGSTASSLSR